MVLDLYGAFSMWTYSNALYNTLWGTFARLLYGAVNNLFFYVTSRIHRCPQNRMTDARPQHRELHAHKKTTQVEAKRKQKAAN